MKNSILIVDDNLLNLKLLKFVLKNKFKIHSAVSGTEALDQLKNFTPNIILLDLQMPIMNGYQLLKVLKSDTTFKNIPVIAITALAMESDKEKIMQAGFDGYITKPIDVNGLPDLLEGFLVSIQHPQGDRDPFSQRSALGEGGQRSDEGL